MSTNKERADRAALALLAHQKDDCYDDERQAREEIKAEPAAILCYLLADLRHLCDEKGLYFAKADKRGYEEYLQDLAEERQAKKFKRRK